MSSNSFMRVSLATSGFRETLRFLYRKKTPRATAKKAVEEPTTIPAKPPALRSLEWDDIGVGLVSRGLGEDGLVEDELVEYKLVEDALVEGN